MRKFKTAEGEYYHVYLRGNNKQDIFYDTRDMARLLFLITCFQSPVEFDHISRFVDSITRSSALDISKKLMGEIVQKRYVELVNFTFMPNHFHLLVGEVEGNGISKYMQRILTAFSKYINIKYEKSGHVFQGPFQIVHVVTNEQLLHLSAYIHRNPRELKEWKNKEHLYPWSSYQDYVGENRWENLLKRNVILDQFENGQEYHEFVKTSGVKEFLDEELLLD
jgi:putative transposase